MNCKPVTLITFILLISAQVFSQGKYMKEDDRVFAGAYSFASMDEVMVNTINVGYSVDRTVDIGVSLGFNEDMRAFAAGFTFNAFKDDFVMFSPSVGIVNYAFLSLNNDANISITGFYIGAGLSKRITLSNNVALVPAFSISETLLENSPFIEEKNFFSASINFALVINTNSNVYFGVEPSILYSSDKVGLSITGFIIF